MLPIDKTTLMDLFAKAMLNVLKPVMKDKFHLFKSESKSNSVDESLNAKTSAVSNVSQTALGAG
jgi:hypothetical protein